MRRNLKRAIVLAQHVCAMRMLHRKECAGFSVAQRTANDGEVAHCNELGAGGYVWPKPGC